MEGAVRPAVLALVGEAGIGKTRLAEWAIERARARGRFVVQGNSHLGLPEPLGVLRCCVLEPFGGWAWSRRPGTRSRQASPTSPARDPGRTPSRRRGRYVRSAGRRGLLLVLEDLHRPTPAA